MFAPVSGPEMATALLASSYLWPVLSGEPESPGPVPLTRPANSKNLIILSSSAEPAKQRLPQYSGASGMEDIPAGADAPGQTSEQNGL